MNIEMEFKEIIEPIEEGPLFKVITAFWRGSGNWTFLYRTFYFRNGRIFFEEEP